MSEDKITRNRERLRVFLFLIPPTFAACACVFFLLFLKLKTIPAAALGFAFGVLIAYALSGYLLDNVSRSNRDLKQRLQENLSEAASEKDKLETILTQITDGILTIGNEGEIIHANDAARVMLRMTDDDVRLKKYDDIILRFSDDLTLRRIHAELESGRSGGMFAYGGAEYEVRFEKFMAAGGYGTGVIIILRDVTEQRKIDSMQVDFVANVSHELKTPLTTIKGYTETLLEGALEDRAMSEEFLNIINSETDRMNHLVKDLLQLTRMDMNQQRWEMRDVDIVALVRTAAKKMGMLARAKHQQLNFFASGKGPIMLLMDDGRIEQVVINVISNAIKYTKEHGRIDIDIIKSTGWAYITVLDNGVGIPEKELSRVFERFFMVDKSRGMGGTGLGLSISKQIVEGHGGTIRAESEFGRGTKITISLPMPQVD